MIEITLNEAEVKMAVFVGNTRNQGNEARGVPDKVDNLHLTQEQYNDRMGAEIAFCKWANVYWFPALTTGKHDAVLPDGRTVDVKCPTSAKGALTVNNERIGWSDLYCLVQGKLPHYRIVGIATTELLLDHPTENQYGPCFQLKASEVPPIEDFDYCPASSFS